MDNSRHSIARNRKFHDTFPIIQSNWIQLDWVGLVRPFSCYTATLLQYYTAALPHCYISTKYLNQFNLKCTTMFHLLLFNCFTFSFNGFTHFILFLFFHHIQWTQIRNTGRQMYQFKQNQYYFIFFLWSSINVSFFPSVESLNRWIGCLAWFNKQIRVQSEFEASRT